MPHLGDWQMRSDTLLLPQQYKCLRLCIAQCNISFPSAWQNHTRAHHNTIGYTPSCHPRGPLEAACLRSSHHEVSLCRRTFPGRRIALWPMNRTWVAGMEGTCRSLLFLLLEVEPLVVGYLKCESVESPTSAFLWGLQYRNTLSLWSESYKRKHIRDNAEAGPHHRCSSPWLLPSLKLTPWSTDIIRDIPIDHIG